MDDSQTGPKPRNHPEYWLFFYSNFTFCVPNLTKTLGWKGGFKDLGKFYQITLRFLDLPLAELSLLETVSDIPAHYENTMKRNLCFLHLTPIRCHIAKKKDARNLVEAVLVGDNLATMDSCWAAPGGWWSAWSKNPQDRCLL